MAIFAEGEPGAPSPMEAAQAEKILDQTQSQTVAGALRFAQEQVERRAQALAEAEAQVARERAELRAARARVEELHEQALAAVRDARTHADTILAAAQKQASAIISEAADEGTNTRKRGLADAEIFRSEARTLYGVSAEVGEAARRLPPEPRSRLDVVESTINRVLDHGATLVNKFFADHPDKAARIMERAAGFVGDGAAPPPAGRRPTLTEVEGAIERLGKDRLAEQLKAWGLSKIDDITTEQAAELVRIASAAGPNGSG